jgi:tetratricopeptide (TPR) repeat protein
MDLLARILAEQGALGEARTLYERTLEIQRRVLGPEHPDALTSMNHLANVLSKQGALDEARTLHERTLEIRRRTLGPEHPETLMSQSNLANTLRAQGKLDESCRLHRQTLELRRRTLGPDHNHTVSSVRNLGETLFRMGRINEARTLFEEAVEKRRHTLGRGHPETLRSTAGLAAVLGALGRLDEARTLFEEVLEPQQRLLGRGHHETLSTMNGLVQVLLASLEFSGCVRARALELARQGAGLDPKSQLLRVWLGVAEYRDGHWEAAIQVAERCMEAPGDDHKALPWLVLALAHAHRGEMDQARVWYAKARPAIDTGKTAETPRWLIDEAKSLLDAKSTPDGVTKEPTSRSASPPR